MGLRASLCTREQYLTQWLQGELIACLSENGLNHIQLGTCMYSLLCVHMIVHVCVYACMRVCMCMCTCTCA